ncbi:hypothetical protein HA050_20215 [Iodobacter sp. HSC-16F04]|uniref:Uncharacterized protein n=1 Tax=Iodobacter violaceini TaxID=3044271 RepID=A0ABX0L2B7_9NEIS|nr:hypothetical protein [Iodobacter violacea]NHQ88429.1 hypothetical protein [Iodobacter violacea]
MTASTSTTDTLGWHGKIDWTEGISTEIRREAFTVTSMGGLLDVRGDDFEAALLVGGKIRVFQWSDCRGSVGQNLVRKISTDKTRSELSFRKSVEVEVSGDYPLGVHFSEILNVLAIGEYALVLEEIPADAYVVDLTDKSENGLEVTSFYPGFGALIATQPLSSLSAAHVNHLAQDIQNGARPTVITLCTDGAWGEFIIDGHHKLPAYRIAGIPVRRLNIVRLNNDRLPLAEILNFVPITGDLRNHVKEYRLG